MLSGLFSYQQTLLTKTIPVSADTIQFDTVAVYRTGFELQVDGQIYPAENYLLDPVHARLVFVSVPAAENFSITYERMPIDFGMAFKHKSRDLIISDTVQNFEPFVYSVSSSNPTDDLFGSSKLNKQGSISRGVTVGNAQSLSLQSTLNLQLDGQIAPNLYMKGSISDDNVPFQPEG